MQGFSHKLTIVRRNNLKSIFSFFGKCNFQGAGAQQKGGCIQIQSPDHLSYFATLKLTGYVPS
jgi:hypothetical protein